jgi:hypothetical protein
MEGTDGGTVMMNACENNADTILVVDDAQVCGDM